MLHRNQQSSLLMSNNFPVKWKKHVIECSTSWCQPHHRISEHILNNVWGISLCEASVGNFWRNSSSVFDRIKGHSLCLQKIHILVAPFLLIPAHTHELLWMKIRTWSLSFPAAVSLLMDTWLIWPKWHLRSPQNTAWSCFGNNDYYVYVVQGLIISVKPL